MKSFRVQYRYNESYETHDKGVLANTAKSAKNKVQRQIGKGGKVLGAHPAKRK